MVTKPAGEAAFYNIPAAPSILIGRDQDLTSTSQLLGAPAARLLTLVGPGGVGKTRLALLLAESLRGDFAAGVCLVELAALAEPALLIATIAKALQVKDSGSNASLGRLSEYLDGKSMLLVLDNFEQLIGASSSVAELLAACPLLKVLATSRAPLHIRGEQQYEVLPLALPHGNGKTELGAAALLRFPAVELFNLRAKSTRHSFAITDANATAIAEICSRLDGLPLAIELMAARVNLLTVDAMLARMGHSLQLLSGGARDLPLRQQTMRNTIAWSINLLSADEQALFRRIALFVGGCNLLEIEAVCGDSGVEAGDLLDRLGVLLDNSLLRQDGADASGEPRFVMLETIREYGLEQLERYDEATLIRARYNSYYINLAEKAAPDLVAPPGLHWLEKLEPAHDNLRAVVSWSLQTGAATLATQLCGALWRFWQLSGYISEGRRWLEAALAASQQAEATIAPVPAAIRARAALGAGMLAFEQGDYSAAWEYLELGLALGRQEGDKVGTAQALRGLGLILWRRGEYKSAETPLLEGLALSRELGDTKLTSHILNALSLNFSDQLDYAQARRYGEEALLLRRTLGYKTLIGPSLINLGLLACEMGDYDAANLLLKEGLELVREQKNKRFMAYAMSNLGMVARRQKDYDRALELCRASMQLIYELGDRYSIAQHLEELAWLAEAQDQWDRAARLWGMEAALRASLDAARDPASQADYDRSMALLREKLSPDLLTTAWAAGAAMSLKEASAYALGSTDEPMPTGDAPLANPDLKMPLLLPPAEAGAMPGAAKLPVKLGAGSSELSGREIDVLRLVARGLPDAEVAAQLTLSLHTVRAHLRSIYSKLNVTSRSAATRYAIEHGVL